MTKNNSGLLCTNLKKRLVERSSNWTYLPFDVPLLSSFLSRTCALLLTASSLAAHDTHSRIIQNQTRLRTHRQPTTQRPSRCRRKSSRSQASSLASTLATVRLTARRLRYPQAYDTGKKFWMEANSLNRGHPKDSCPQDLEEEGFPVQAHCFRS